MFTKKLKTASLNSFKLVLWHFCFKLKSFKSGKIKLLGQLQLYSWCIWKVLRKCKIVKICFLTLKKLGGLKNLFEFFEGNASPPLLIKPYCKGIGLQYLFIVHSQSLKGQLIEKKYETDNLIVWDSNFFLKRYKNVKINSFDKYWDVNNVTHVCTVQPFVKGLTCVYCTTICQGFNMCVLYNHLSRV